MPPTLNMEILCLVSGDPEKYTKMQKGQELTEVQADINT